MPQINLDLALAEPRRRSKRRRSNDTIRMHRLPVCSETGKVRYRDHDQARDGLVSAKEARMRDESAGVQSRRREARSYKCPECRGWHNTSLALWVEATPVDAAVAAATTIIHLNTGLAMNTVTATQTRVAD